MIKMIRTYFSEDSKGSVKWRLDEALQPKTPAEYILSLPAQTCFQDWEFAIIILVIENCNQNKTISQLYLERIPKNKQVGTHSFTKW